MKYEVIRACGHKEEVQIYGKEEEREKKIRWFESTECTACCRKRLYEKAKKENQAAGLPPLKGTEKQIAWSEVIRANIFDALASVMVSEKEEARGSWAAMIRWYAAKTDARFWINHWGDKIIEPIPAILEMIHVYQAAKKKDEA